MPTAIFAHRGNVEAAPENTLAAFRAVAECGAEGVEFDVQASKDGVPVVIHDESLKRTTDGTGHVHELTLAELRELDAGSWRGPAFAGERIPTLEEVLAVFRSRNTLLNIEMKTQGTPYPGLAQAAIARVREAGVGERVIFSSFNHHTLLELGWLAPEIPRAALTYAHLVAPWEYLARHGFQGLHPNYPAVTADLVEGCHKAGFALRTYTVNDEETAARLIRLGVDAIVTNVPSRMAALRDRLQREG